MQQSRYVTDQGEEVLPLTSTDAPTRGDVHLAEYEQLKAEQRDRITNRDRLFWFVFITVGVVGYQAFTTSNPHLLLAIPAVLTVIGWIYVTADRQITALRRYFRDMARDLAIETGSAPDEPPLLAWEQPSESRSLLRRTFRLYVLLNLYVAPGFTAIGAWLYLAPRPYPPLLLAVAGAVLIDVLALQMVFMNNAFSRVDRPSRAASDG